MKINDSLIATALGSIILISLVAFSFVQGQADNANIFRNRNLQSTQLTPNNADVTRSRNFQSPLLEPNNAYVTRFRNSQPFELGEFVPIIEIGRYESYKISDNVFGVINLTSDGGFSNCTVEFQVMAPSGNLVYIERQNVSLQANTETPVLFTWTCGHLPLGDYYSRFIVVDLETQIFDSGWFFGYAVTKPIFFHDFGSLHEHDYKAHVMLLNLNRGQQSVFNFSLSKWIGYLEVTINGTNGSDFIVEVRNETLYAGTAMYIVDGPSSMRIKNAPKGDFEIVVTAQSLMAQLFEISITTSFEAYPILSYTMSDGLSNINNVEGLCGTTKSYSLTIRYYTNSSEKIALTIRNATNGIVLHQSTEDASLFSIGNQVEFKFSFEFPPHPTFYDLEFNLTLTESKESLLWTVQFVARKPPYQITLEYDAQTSYYRSPSSLNFLKQWAFYPVAKETLEALEVSNAKIIDISVEEGILKNVTVRFEVTNKYVKNLLWMTAYTYYDLYIYPVCVAGKNVEVYRSVVLYGEHEDVVVRGIPVTYVDGKPKVYFHIEFRKSHWANVLDWALRRGLKLLTTGKFAAGTHFSDLVMEFVNVISDHMYSYVTIDDALRMLEAVGKGVAGYKLEELMLKSFGTTDPELICESMPPFALAMYGLNWKDDFSAISSKIVGELLSYTFETMKDRPEVFYSIIRDVDLALGIDWRSAGTVPFEEIKSFASSALLSLAVAEGLWDCLVDVLVAPDHERKQTTAYLNEPIEGDFTEVNLGDPMLSISLSGSISNSVLKTFRLYSIESLWIDARRNSNGTTSFAMKIMSSSNYTGAFRALFSDPDLRSGLLSYFGILSNNTVLEAVEQSLLVEGTGTSVASYDLLSMHIGDGQLEIDMKQPFQAKIENGTGYINLPMFYPFGENLTYSIELVVPEGSVDIQVLSGGNYTIQDNKIVWTEPIDQILVTFAPPPWTVEYIGIGGYPIVDFAVYNGKLYAAADNTLYVCDGSSWNIINAPTYITSLTSYNNKLIIGGQGGLYIYDGVTFTQVFQVSTYIKALGEYNNILYAGTFLDRPPTLYYCNGPAENPANWHIDTNFSAILNFSGPFGSIDSFAVYNDNMYVTFGGIIYCYNGTGWSIAKTYDDVYAYLDMKVYNGKLYLATRDQAWRKPYYQGGTGFSGRVVEYDGSNWATIFDHNYWIFSLETYDNKLYVGTANKIYTYDGTSWSLSFNAVEDAYYAIAFITFNGKIYVGMGNGYIFVDQAVETIVLPEYPSTTFLSIIMLLSMLVLVFTKRRRCQTLKT